MLIKESQSYDDHKTVHQHIKYNESNYGTINTTLKYDHTAMRHICNLKMIIYISQVKERKISLALENISKFYSLICKCRGTVQN